MFNMEIYWFKFRPSTFHFLNSYVKMFIFLEFHLSVADFDDTS